MDGFCNWYGQCWLHVVEFLAGDGGQVAKGRELNKRVGSSLNTSRFLATVGWSIYPLSYFFGYLFSIVVDNVFNLAYNLADTPYKIWFVAAVWQDTRLHLTAGQVVGDARDCPQFAAICSLWLVAGGTHGVAVHFMLSFVFVNEACSMIHAGQNQFYSLGIGWAVVAGEFDRTAFLEAASIQLWQLISM